MLRAIVEAEVPFAIKGGGHATIAGASNINGTGVTLDLSFLADISLSKDKQTVVIGSGSKWSDVYAFLEPYGLSVPGGRVGVVGVGGFLLGGGLSWFSNIVGWSCDSVTAFEVLLANGKLVEATQNHYADLFWALKGGGGIYGLVTSFRMRTVASAIIWGGALEYTSGQESLLFANLVTMVQTMAPEDQSSTYVSCAYIPTLHDTRCSSYLVDLTANPRPSLLKPFLGLSHTSGNLRTMNLSESADESADYTNKKFRQAKFTLTMHANAELLDQIYLQFVTASKTWSFESSNSLTAMTFQPLSASHLSGRDNALGFSAAVDSLILFSFEARWLNGEDDGYFERQTWGLYDDLTALASNMGLLHRWVYANYAGSWQDVYAGYGQEVEDRLRDVRKKYDKDGVFSALRRGGLKLTPGQEKGVD